MPLDIDNLLTIREKLRKLRKTYKPKGNIKQESPPGINFLTSLIEEADNKGDIVALSTMLDSEYSFYGMQDEVEKLRWKLAEFEPDEPMPWITLATFYYSEKNDLEQAKTIINKAIKLAKQKKRFTRHAYNTCARIARRLNDFKLLEETLVNLINYDSNPNNVDIAFERDFLVGLPNGIIDEKVLKDYQSLVE